MLRTRRLSAVMVAILTSTILAQTPIGSPALYKRKESATTYHTADCPFVKAQGYEMVPATIQEVALGRLSACTVCHPRTKSVEEAIDQWRADQAAAEKARQNKAAADAAARAETAAAAARAKSEAAAAERKRREAEPLIRVTEAKLRPVIMSAMSQAHNDTKVFDSTLLPSLQAIAPDYQGPVPIVSSSDLVVLAQGPVARLHVAAREAVRKFESLPAVLWSNDVDLVVAPTRIDSPDIEKIVVQRNGLAVAAIRSSLALRQLSTAMGASKMIHSGSVTFPLSAFDPGAGVTATVILIPSTGDNIVRSFGSIELRAFQ
ncbi:MAG TPA: hypothetical protein VJN96_14310 [Vicinamibacterales bacterium]|nr:hypothetical protein [Vicinamibacterales bacterium]